VKLAGLGVLVVFGLLVCDAAAPTARAGAAPAACPVTDVVDELGPLPHLAAALKPGATLEMLALGSGTVFAPVAGIGADVARPGAPPAPVQPSQAGFPFQAAHALEAAVHGLHVNVTVIGRHGMTAADMFLLLRQELPRKPYRLVLWQTGTVEAVNDLPPEDFYQTLADGASLADEAGADLVLIDPQYSRFLAANANLEPYQSAFQAAAALPGVGLFHRYDLMHDWVESGAIDLERAPKAERQAVAVRLHMCLGRELARALLASGG
jgi:hypothetical protein